MIIFALVGGRHQMCISRHLPASHRVPSVEVLWVGFGFYIGRNVMVDFSLVIKKLFHSKNNVSKSHFLNFTAKETYKETYRT